jgi:nucleotide-binding universal stress UspA family protein/MFS family permease
MRQGRLAGRYFAVAALVVCSLVPYLVLSAALQPLEPIIARDLGTTAQEMSLANGIANAGYALGTVVSVQLALLLPQRRLLLAYGTLLVIGSVLAAAATAPAVFIAGHVTQGLCTSMLLIAAVPPLVIGYPESKLRPTLLILNLGLFGAVALGPFIGGLQAEAGNWRPLFWIIAAIAVLALVLSVLTFVDAPPAAAESPDEPRAGDAAGSADGPPKDPLAVGLAAAGCLLAFYGASELRTHEFVGARTLLPLAVGASLIAVLVSYQFTAKRPLLAVRGILRSTFPVAGIVAAICAAAGSVGATGLTAATLADRYAPLHVGVLYLPEFAGAVIAALTFARMFQTRYIHWMALSGLVLLAAGTVVMIAQIPPSPAATLAGSGLVGVGLGASVVPALFIAGLTLRNSGLQRVFAIVELFRGVAAFMIAPILVHIAATVGGGGAAGTRTALWICFGLAAGGALTAVGLYALGGRRPPTPDMNRWFAGEAGAWDSPPLFARLRGAPRPRLQPGTILRHARDGAIARLEGRRPATGNGPGPIVFAYDGSKLAQAAIEEAGRQLRNGREALVLTVWRPADLEFVPDPDAPPNPFDVAEVREAAQRVATHGASIAGTAGFRAHPVAVQAAPSWKGIVDFADEHAASAIVLGSHGRSGLTGALIGSVAEAVAAHSKRTVVIAHGDSRPGSVRHGQPPRA